MKIVAVETYWTRIPYDMGGTPAVMSGINRDGMNTIWLRLITDQGIEGWGEAFGHGAAAVSLATLNTQLAPAVLGQDARDMRAMMRRLEHTYHLFGRNGPHVYALSALDIALWDIAGKAAGLPIWRMLGGSPTPTLTAYASLLRYGTAPLVAKNCERAIAQGYQDIKLHEITAPEIMASRQASGPDVRIMCDTNCPWTIWQAIEMANRVADANLTWLEEPVWPPNDYDGLARVRIEGGIPIAAGENAAGLHDFKVAFDAGALDIAQPSVIKTGGISAMVEIAALCKAHGVRLVPHNAYFGPGFLASLQVNAALASTAPFERLFLDMEASPYHDMMNVKDGKITVPDGPGLGRDPDMDVMKKYLVGAPTVFR